MGKTEEIKLRSGFLKVGGIFDGSRAIYMVWAGMVKEFAVLEAFNVSESESASVPALFSRVVLHLCFPVSRCSFFFACPSRLYCLSRRSQRAKKPTRQLDRIFCGLGVIHLEARLNRTAYVFVGPLSFDSWTIVPFKLMGEKINQCG